MDDRELDELLRAANPAPIRREDPLSEFGLALLSDLTDASEKVTPVRRRRTFAPLLGAAAAAVVLVGVVIAVGGAGKDSALLPPLVTAPMDADAASVMNELGDLLAEQGDDGGGDSATVRVATWSLGSASSGGVETSAGDSPVGDSGEVQMSAESMSEVPQEESAWREIIVADSDLPTNPAEIGAYLSGLIGISNPELPDYMIAVRELIDTQALSAAREAALLTFLGEQDGFDVVGSITDRIGRDGVLFRAGSPQGDDLSYLLIVSPNSGRIRGIEAVNADNGVVEYTLWDR